MNVFIIPGWYPHRCHPLEGVFVRDQAEALGELRPDWNIALSLWGQGLRLLTAAHVLHSPRCLWDSIRDGASRTQALRANVIEFLTPATTWSVRWFHGNRGRVLNANRVNLGRAMRRLGNVDILHAHLSYPSGWAAMKLSDET